MPFTQTDWGRLRRAKAKANLPGPEGVKARQWLADYYRQARNESGGAPADEMEACRILTFGRDYYVAGSAIGANEREAVKLELGITGRLTKAHLERANYTVINGRWVAPDGTDQYLDNTGTCPF